LPVIKEKLVKNYFIEKEKIRRIQKKVKREKEKKLANFFGENPSVDPIKKQIFSITMNLNIKDSALNSSNKLQIDDSLIFNDDDAESSNEKLNSSSRIFYDDSSSEIESLQYLSSEDIYGLNKYKANEIDNDEYITEDSQELKNSSIYIMKKKADKLQQFFGDKVQINQLYEQQALQNEIGENGLYTLKLNNKSPSIDCLSNINNLFNSKGTVKFNKNQSLFSNEELPKTENFMDNSQRKMMTRRTNKINSILGTVIDEKLTCSVIDAANTTNEFLHPLPKSISFREKLDSDKELKDDTNDKEENDSNSDSGLDSNKGNMTQVRRMKKLHHVFGETIDINTLMKLKIKRNEIEKKNKIEKGIFTEYERRDIKNRCKKLENIFGTVPPTMMINLNSSNNPKNNNAFIKHRNSIISLSMMFAYDKEIADVMDIVSEFDGESIISADNNDDLENSKEINKAKLKKLRKFFGNDIDPASIINFIIISDLRKAIDNDIIDEDQKKQLNSELNIIWEDIQEKSRHFMDLISEDTSKINGSTESINKSSKSFKKYKTIDLGKSKKTSSSVDQLKSLYDIYSDSEDTEIYDSKWKDYVIDWLKTNHKI
jgi:uncharacterized protein YoxC